MTTGLFILCTGFCLGLMIALVSAGIFSAPGSCIAKIFLNSITGAAILCIFNVMAKPLGIYVSLNPLTAVFVGVLGIPGVVSLVVLSFIL